MVGVVLPGGTEFVAPPPPRALERAYYLVVDYRQSGSWSFGTR